MWSFCIEVSMGNSLTFKQIFDKINCVDRLCMPTRRTIHPFSTHLLLGGFNYREVGFMKSFKDLTGQKFGRLFVIGRANNKSGKPHWLCKCDCGNEVVVEGYNLKTGHTRSCGCLQKETNIKRLTTHDLSKSRIYRTWRAIKNRCFNKNLKEYKNYGGRGIIVCAEWLNDFQAFYDWSIMNGYTDELTIDRIDNDGNYEPLNCRWTTRKEQANNRRMCRIFTYNGVTKNYKQWCDFLNINYKTFHTRISRGWEIEKALGLE